MKPYSILDNIVFLYIETNSSNDESNKIIKICAVKIKDNVVTKFNTLINPNRLAALRVSDLLRGITQKELDSAPQLKDAVNKLLPFIEDLPLVYHYEAFKENFLKVDNEFLDLMELIAMLFPELTDFSLQYLLKRFLNNCEEDRRSFSCAENVIRILNYAIISFFYENSYTLPMSMTELEAWSWYKQLTKVNMDHVKGFIEGTSTELQEKATEPYPVFALKDYEKLLLNLKRDVSYTLIKGKSNYLCLDRFKDIEYPGDMKTLIGYVYLKRLMTEKGIGEVEEINPIIIEKFNLNSLINQCNCDSELCNVGICKYKDQCYYAAKVEALKESQLIVVNHSLLLK